YHGRDVAVMRARQVGALAVLGSATPALETYRHTDAGRYRRIVLSDVYQQSSAERPAALRKDPEKKLLWRMNRRRLDFEAQRDSLNDFPRFIRSTQQDEFDRGGF
ncbi:MAG: primosomal protein N', partial [Alphaproteobacteria bacterium MarineAlpha3_Bin1]